MVFLALGYGAVLLISYFSWAPRHGVFPGFAMATIWPIVIVYKLIRLLIAIAGAV